MPMLSGADWCVQSDGMPDSRLPVAKGRTTLSFMESFVYGNFDIVLFWGHYLTAPHYPTRHTSWDRHYLVSVLVRC